MSFIRVYYAFNSKLLQMERDAGTIQPDTVISPMSLTLWHAIRPAGSPSPNSLTSGAWEISYASTPCGAVLWLTTQPTTILCPSACVQMAPEVPWL